MGLRIAVIIDAPHADASAARTGARLADALAKEGHEPTVLVADAALAGALRDLRPTVALLATGPAAARTHAPQSLLEYLRVPYVGTSARMCALAGDRVALGRALEVAAQAGPVEAASPAGVTMSAQALRELGGLDVLDLVGERVPGGYPVVVRPARGAHGVGVTKVEAPEGLRAAVERAAEADDDVLVQQWVDGRELSVCVLGDGEDVGVLPPVGVARDAHGSASSFEPVRMAELADDVADAEAARSQIERDALDAFYACGARDLARIDLIWDGARSRVIGVDVAPSLAEGAALDVALRAAGLDLGEVLDELVTGAASRG